jgi:two-component system, NtrC family, response regulator AtoC
VTDSNTMSAPAIRASELPAEDGFVFGQGKAMEALNATVAEIARTDIPVLILGASGTGKEVYARLLHRLSRSCDAPLGKVSCSLLDPSQLLEQFRDGLLPPHTTSHPGTLFLDSVDELDLACQRVLLSMLPDGQGRNGSGSPDKRLICSSRRNLEEDVEAGRFRKELYFRINGVTLRLPSLRDRKEDIPALMDFFLAKYATLLNREVPALDGVSMEQLLAHDWPGNIRELENIARKIVALGESKTALEELRMALHGELDALTAPRVSPLKTAARAALRRTERELILKALERTHWNRKRAAQELQISYKSLLSKIKQAGLERLDSE